MEGDTHCSEVRSSPPSPSSALGLVGGNFHKGFLLSPDLPSSPWVCIYPKACSLLGHASTCTHV